MDIGAEKMEIPPVYRQHNLNNGTGDTPYRRSPQIDKSTNDYCLFPMQNGTTNNPFECDRGKEEESNNKLTAKWDEPYRIEFIKILRENYTGMPNGFEDWSFKEIEKWVMDDGYKLNKVAKSLAYLIPAAARPGDCGRSAFEKPEWLDFNLFRQGQKFAMDNFFSTSFVNLLSLCVTFTDKELLRPLIVSSHSDTPYRSFNRYLATADRVRSWYTEDPWEVGSTAYKNIAIVRRKHTIIRNRLCGSNREKIMADSTITEPWSSICDIFTEDANSACPINPNWYNYNAQTKYKSVGFSQADMSMTQFMFVGFAITHPEAFGIHNTDEADLFAFCHLWRAIGYFLGVEDEYNFCRGSLSEVKQRATDIFERILIPNFRTVDADWEHMTRCLVCGISFYLPMLPKYEALILYMTDLLKVPMPRLLNLNGYGNQIRLILLKFFCYYIIKIPGVSKHYNQVVNHCIDKALAFSPKKHSALEGKSTKILLDFTVG